MSLGQHGDLVGQRDPRAQSKASADLPLIDICGRVGIVTMDPEGFAAEAE